LILFVVGDRQYSSSRCFGVIVLKVSARLCRSRCVVMVPTNVIGSSKMSVVSSDGLVLSVFVAFDIVALVFWLSVCVSRFASLADTE